MIVFAKKLSTRGLRHRHSILFYNELAFTLVHQFSNVLSEKRKRDTSPKEGGGGVGSQAP